MVIFAEFRRWLNTRDATLLNRPPTIQGEVEGRVLSFSSTESIPHNEARPTYVYDVFIRGELKYQFMESIWYDTASPAQWCIARLREIKEELPGVVICGFGTEYKIDTLEELKRWTKDVFSPTGCSYVCDFSKYL
jgi:hypothetical protein